MSRVSSLEPLILIVAVSEVLLKSNELLLNEHTSPVGIVIGRLVLQVLHSVPSHPSVYFNGVLALNKPDPRNQ